MKKFAFYLLIGWGFFPYFLFLLCSIILVPSMREFDILTKGFDSYLKNEIEWHTEWECKRTHPLPPVTDCIKTEDERRQEQAFDLCYKTEREKEEKEIAHANSTWLGRLEYFFDESF